LKSKVFDGEAVVDEFGEGVDADAEVEFRESGCHLAVAVGGFYAFRDHRLIGYQEEGASGDFVMETGDEDGGGLHVDGHAVDAAQVVLEVFVMFPDAAVRGVNCTGPVVALVIADGGGDRFLEAESREGGNFGREIVV